MSFVNHGYHKLEVSADEIFYSNLAFRTGVQKFYNIILAGIKPENTMNADNVWTFGYGIGMAPPIRRWLHLNVDLTAQHINKGSFTEKEFCHMIENVCNFKKIINNFTNLFQTNPKENIFEKHIFNNSYNFML